MRLRGEGKPADVAVDLATELALAGVREEAAGTSDGTLSPTGEGTAAVPAPAERSAVEQELERLKAEAAEREASEAAKRKLLAAAGASENIRTLINWALKNAPMVSGGALPAWERVTSHPPGPGALWYLEQSFLNPQQFAAMVAKSQTKEVDDRETQIQVAEKKRRDELLGMLGDLAQEVENEFLSHEEHRKLEGVRLAGCEVWIKGSTKQATEAQAIVASLKK